MIKILTKFCLTLTILAIANAASAQKFAIGEKIANIKELRKYRKMHKPMHKYQYIGFVHTTSIPSEITSADLMAMADSANIMDIVFLSKERADHTADWFRKSADSSMATFAEMGHIFEQYDIDYVPYGVITNSRRRVVWAGNPELLTTAKIRKIIENHK